MTVRTCDVHTHLAPLLDSDLPGVLRVDGRLTVDGADVAHDALYDSGRLSDWARGRGVEEAWVSPPPPFYRQQLEAGECAAWARELNAGMVRRLDGAENLRLLEYLPLESPEVALAAVAAGPTASATVGWSAAAGGRSVPLDDAVLEPVWEQLAAHGLPVVLHPADSPDTRLRAHYLANLLGNPVETAVAFGQLLFGGVLDRHPGLRLVLVHCGGVLPAVLGRWARGVATRRPGLSSSAPDPLTACRRVWVDALAHDPRLVDLALDLFGPDRVVLGSDYPFPMGVDDPFESIAHLDPQVRARVAQNAALLVGGRR